MKKILLVNLSLLTLALSGCSSKDTNEILKVEGVKNEKVVELARQAVLGFAALPNNTSNVKAKRALNEDEIIDVKDALNEIDLLLNNDSKLLAKEIDSDREDFKFALELSLDMFDKKEELTLYYNEIKIREEHDDDFEESLEIEKEFRGIALKDNLEYEFRFSMEEEKELFEEEKESSFTLYLNETSFVKIKQGYEEETDEKETFYSYTLVKDNKKVEEYEFKEEFENNRHHIELEKNGREYKVNYITHNNEELIRVALKISGKETAVGHFKRIINLDSSITYELVNI